MVVNADAIQVQSLRPHTRPLDSPSCAVVRLKDNLPTLLTAPQRRYAGQLPTGTYEAEGITSRGGARGSGPGMSVCEWHPLRTRGSAGRVKHQRDVLRRAELADRRVLRRVTGEGEQARLEVMLRREFRDGDPGPQRRSSDR
jgi:hypothetical protein